MYEYNTSSRSNTEEDSKSRLVSEVIERVFENGELVSEIVTKEYDNADSKAQSATDFFDQLGRYYSKFSQTF